MKLKLFIQLLAIALMLAMLLPTLASCVTITDPQETTAESTTPQSETTKPEDTDKSPTNIEGNITGQTYKNLYFNLSLHLPAHWYFESDSKIASNPLTCFSNRTTAQKAASEFVVDCRAVNDATADAIEITIEKKKEKVSDPWYSISEYFKNKPKGWESTKTDTNLFPRIAPNVI